jgi:hypothetical protein
LPAVNRRRKRLKKKDPGAVRRVGAGGRLVTLYKEFLPEKRVYKWTPHDIEAKFNRYARGEDLGIQHLGGKTIAYNSEVYNECPVDSLWDLTRP